ACQLCESPQMLALVPSVALHRLNGCGKDPVRIAGRHPDAHRAHDDTEPSATTGIRRVKTAPWPIREAVIGFGHGLAPAYFCAQRGQCRVDARRPLTGTLRQ